MVKSEVFNKQMSLLRERRLIDFVLEEDLMFFVMFFVENYCQEICDHFEQKGNGKPRFPIKNMISLLLYSYCNKNTSPTVIAKNTRYNIPSMILMDGLMPSRRSISRYRYLLACHYKSILSKTLQLALDLGLTDFDHVAIDGTIIKAYNSSFNVIRKTDVKKLLRILENEDYDEKVIKSLRRSAYNLLYSDMKLKEKIDFLYHILEELKETGQKSCSLYDTEARWMLNKKRVKEHSYNLQSAIDYTTKLILAVHVTNEATDHYQLPPTLTKAIENCPVPLNKISADTAYHNEISNDILQEYNLDGYIC